MNIWSGAWSYLSQGPTQPGLEQEDAAMYCGGCMPEQGLGQLLWYVWKQEGRELEEELVLPSSSYILPVEESQVTFCFTGFISCNLGCSRWETCGWYFPPGQKFLYEVQTNQEIQESRHLDIQKSRKVDIEISRYPEMQTSKYLEFSSPSVVLDIALELPAEAALSNFDLEN